MVNVLVFVMLLAVVSAVLFIVPSLMTRRAVSKVIEIFCRLGALDAEHAKTLDELGLAPRTFFEKIGKPRDYKPRALNFLKDANVLRVTPDGKLYLPYRELGQKREGGTLVARQVGKALKRYAGNDGSSHNAV